MKTKADLLAVMDEYGACPEATEYVTNHTSDSVEEIGLDCDNIGWLTWLLVYESVNLTDFVNGCAGRARGHADAADRARFVAFVRAVEAEADSRYATARAFSQCSDTGAGDAEARYAADRAVSRYLILHSYDGVPNISPTIVARSAAARYSAAASDDADADQYVDSLYEAARYADYCYASATHKATNARRKVLSIGCSSELYSQTRIKIEAYSQVRYISFAAAKSAGVPGSEEFEKERQLQLEQLHALWKEWCRS